MILFYDNWYQLSSNELWNKPEGGKYDARAFRLFCLSVQKAAILQDNNTIVFVSDKNGYKLRLNQHTAKEQNDIIDALTPHLYAHIYSSNKKI